MPAFKIGYEECKKPKFNGYAAKLILTLIPTIIIMTTFSITIYPL